MQKPFKPTSPSCGNPYEELANAIILQAVQDYRRALRVLRRKPKDLPADDTKTEVERFFLSDWFQALTNIDGEYMVKKLREEAGR